MKKITILAGALFMFTAYHATAQMGIGTPSPSDASMLDVVASDKGVLIPRVALTATDSFGPISGAEVESLLVYNTFTSADLEMSNAVYPGFYYWENGAWQRVVNLQDLNSAIENLGDEFNTSIEQIHDLINYIAPSNPNNLDDNGDQIIPQDHSTVVWDETAGAFYVVTYDAQSGEYVKALIDIDALIEGAETNTFIRIETTADAPDVYHYFSESAIKTWMALDPTNNTDAFVNMPTTEPGVVTIDVVGDVVENFEYILNQEITYEGDTHTIEEVIQMISSEVEGNVIYTEVNGEWVFQYFDGSDYVTINLDELVNELETNTFIRKVDAYTDTNGESIPTTYYYFSEEAIKDWAALDPTVNTDAEANMEVTEPGVIAINVVGDVVENFEYILEQEITYEGEQVTIEEVIQMISSEVEGNVIYTEVNGEWVFQYFDGSDYVTINLDELVNELETNTFIRKVDAYTDTNGESIPTIYYYFSEEAIKDWVALDPTVNTDAETDMDVAEPGVIAINVVGDIVENFEYILNQEITYEGEQVTIEEVIQMISSEVEGNVRYVEINTDEWVFQYFDGTDYVTINLGDLVANLETKTKITRAEITTNGEAPAYVATAETNPTVAGQILYKYDSEDGVDYLNITEDLLFALTNNEEIRNQITHILQNGGGVFFGDITIGGEDYTDVLYYFDDNGEPQLINVARTLIQNLVDNSAQVQELKNILGNKYEDNSIVYTGDTINGDQVAGFKTTTTIGVHTAVTSGVTLPVTPLGVISISLYQNGNLITNSTTDHVITGSDIDFNIGIGNHYQVLPEGTYEVIIEFTVAP